MPVIDDSDEPPAKCCKYCEESTHGVDGPVSWRLTLDQDLIDTLKGSFPNWFQPQAANSSLSKTITTETVVNNHNKVINSGSHNISTVATATDNNNNSKAVTTANDNGNSIIITATGGLQNGLNLLNNTICVTPISIDARAPYLHAQQQQQHNLLSNGIKGKNNNNNTIHLHQLNGAAIKSAALSHAIPLLAATGLSPNSSASPASSVTSNGSAKSHSTISSNSSPLQPINLSNGKLSVKTNLKANEYNSSSPTSSPSSGSSSSSSSSSPTTSSRSSISAKLSKADFSTKTHAKTHKNLNSHTRKLPAVTASLAGPQVTRAGALERFTGGDHSGLHQPIASVGATTITRVIPKSPSLHSLSGGSLLATFSSPGSAATFEIISDSSCTGLLTSAHLSGKSAFEHSFHDIILLQEAYDDMSEGEQRLNASFLGGSSDDGTNSDFYDPRQSPPKAIVDSSPLQPQMDKNKESLKVKLMVRRPHSQLVEQGIIPPLKTSPAIHEQCKQLERAKTSDLLKAKIQQRPNREDLERRHILEEDECHIDPSLAEKQRMLKKARLADQLNSQIQHRPGPLELIKKNILHTEKPIEKIVKEGLVTFKATSEGLLTRPQHPNSYITFEDDSQSSESDTRQTPPRLDCQLAVAGTTTATSSTSTPSSCADVLQAAAASAGIVTVALSIPTSAGQLMVPPTTLCQTKLSTLKSSYVPPPPPPPLPIKVKQETSNLYEELCQSVTGTAASHYLPMVNSPCSFGSSTSTLSPLSSISSPPQSVTPCPVMQSPVLQIGKSDAPGKDKNRKKSKSKPVSKARTIKFHEYKGPPSAAHKLSSESSASTEETSYQLMLEQQNCLLKFLETLNKNQSIIPATSAATTTPTVSVVSTAVKTSSNVVNTVTTATANSTTTLALTTPNNAANTSGQQTESHINNVAAAASIAASPRPPPLPSPALSVASSVPPSPCTSYAESCASSLPDATRLEKMKVSDLKMHLKKRNLPVSGPKPQLIERLRPYLPLDNLDTVIVLPTIPSATTENISNAMETMDHSEINSPKPSIQLEQEQMDVIQQQIDSPKPMTLQTLTQPQPQTATIILSNEELLREQQRKIDELQRQLQRSQQELLEIRQKQQQQVRLQQQPPTATSVSIQKNIGATTPAYKQQTLSAQLVNAMPTQQITLIAATANPTGINSNNNYNNTTQTLTLFQQPNLRDISTPAKLTIKTNTNPVKSLVVPVPIVHKKASNQLQIMGNLNTNITTTTTTTPVMTQKMVVKQQLEAKIQKQKQAQAAAAAAQAQAQVIAQSQAQVIAQSQAQVLAQAQAQAQLKLLTQKTQTVLIPTGPTITTTTTTTATKANDHKLKLKNATLKANTCNIPTANNTTTIVTNQLPLTKTHNNLGLVWNEGNQTIFLVGLNDQHMTAHTIGNISLANATPATKKLLNGHQRTSSLPSIAFPITTTQPVPMASGNNPNEVHKPLLAHQQLHKFQLQQQQHPHEQQQQQQILPQQQIIQLDIKPQNLQPPPPPPLPPPQYEEATKQIKAQQQEEQQEQPQPQQQLQQINILTPLIKIKEEPSTTSALNVSRSGNGVNSNSILNEHKPLTSSIKSEKLNDVFDILMKQRDLTDNNLEPITPVTTPLTPTISNAQMNDLSDNILYSQIEDTKNIIKQENLIDATNKRVVETSQHQQQDELHAMDMDNSRNLNINSIYEFYQKTNTVNNSDHTNNSNNNNGSFVENIDMASPLQPECHVDTESVAKTLDMFLDRHHHQQQQQPQTHQVSPTHHDMLSKACLDNNSTRTSSTRHSNNSPEDAKRNHFDEFELLELMSQQLEMDIQEDNSSYQNQQQNQNQNHNHSQPIKNHLLHEEQEQQQQQQQQQQPQQQHQQNNQHSNDKTTICNGFSHNMNPAYPCSLAQLINSQMLSPESGANDTSPASQAHNILDDFDADCFVQQLAQQNHHHQQQHDQSHHQQLNHQLYHQEQQQHQHGGINNHNNSNNNNHNGLDIINNNCNNTSSTPMEVCDDFENSLSDFNFSSLSPDSNINTPPHPFGMLSTTATSSFASPSAAAQLHGNSLTTCSLQAQSTSCNNAIPNPTSLPLSAHMSASSSSGMPTNSLLQHQCHERMAICNTNCMEAMASGMSGDSSSNANDTFGSNSQDIFDLFNIDDYKMSWVEGEFAV